MTRQQTRLLGIEFVRRLYEMHPEFKSEQKLDTDVIYSMLSEYQRKYINNLYLSLLLTERGTSAARVIYDSIKTLVRHKIISKFGNDIDNDENTSTFNIPDDYLYYLRSNSIICKNYKSNYKLSTSVHTPNVDIHYDDVKDVVGTFYNKGGIIRNPLVVLESTTKDSPYIKVIHDRYTEIQGLDLTYVVEPHPFNVLKYDDNDLSRGSVFSYCELPFECFDNLVTGAIDLYIQNYKTRLAGNTKNRLEERE